MSEFHTLSGTVRVLNKDKSLFATVTYHHPVVAARTAETLSRPWHIGVERNGHPSRPTPPPSSEPPPMVLTKVNSHCMRFDTSPLVRAGEAYRFDPWAPVLDRLPTKQHVIREVRDHVHDPDWCMSHPRSKTDTETKELTPLENSIGRYDFHSQPQIATPEQELLWLDSTKHLDLPSTNKMLREHLIIPVEYGSIEENDFDDAMTWASHREDENGDISRDDHEDRMDALIDLLAPVAEAVTEYYVPSPPTLRRIEWEQQAAACSLVTKWYPVLDYRTGEATVRPWTGRGKQPVPSELSPLAQAGGLIKAWEWFHRLGGDPIALKARRDYLSALAREHKKDWLLQLLTPEMRWYRHSPKGNAAQQQTHRLWHEREFLTDIDGHKPERLENIFYDDDLHRPEEQYRHSRRKEIALAKLTRDPAYGEIEEETHRYRIDRKYVDILALEALTNDAPVELGVDDPFPLRDNEIRIVRRRPIETHINAKGVEVICNHGNWYSQWETTTISKFHWRDADGVSHWKYEFYKGGALDNIASCDCHADNLAVQSKWRASNLQRIVKKRWLKKTKTAREA